MGDWFGSLPPLAAHDARLAASQARRAENGLAGELADRGGDHCRRCGGGCLHALDARHTTEAPRQGPRERWSGPPTRRARGHDRLYNRIDAADQLRAVLAAHFERTRVLGMPEYKLFRTVEDEVRVCRPGFRVFAQTALGEVIKSADRDAHSAINSKRTDVLVIDRAGYPVLAIEYQAATTSGTTPPRGDAVKKEALRRAGVAYLEFFEHSTEEQVRRTVRETIERGVPPAPPETPAVAHPFIQAAKLIPESPHAGKAG
jgi:hypothetical protein